MKLNSNGIENGLTPSEKLEVTKKKVEQINKIADMELDIRKLANEKVKIEFGKTLKELPDDLKDKFLSRYYEVYNQLKAQNLMRSVE